MNKRVLVVDLDGTLYTINTFHYFIKYLILYCIKSFNIVLLFKLCLLLVYRPFTTHAKIKYYVLKLLKHRNDIDYQEFVQSLSMYKREIPQLNDHNFDIKILATAAPTCYANIIAQNEKFNLCLSTDFPNSNFDNAFENSKIIKKENVMNYLIGKNINEIDTLITDHIDDLALMKLSKRNIIANPDEKLTIALKQNLIYFEEIM